jgi:ribosomal protein S27AE
MRFCGKCGTAKLASEFGKKSWCKPCCAAYDRAFYEKNKEKIIARTVIWQRGYRAKYPERMRKWSQESYRRNRERNLTHRAVYYATKTGKLIRPKKCSQCGDSNSRIEGHHLDYSKRLEVIWLCRKCHAAVHPRDNAHPRVPYNPR